LIGFSLVTCRTIHTENLLIEYFSLNDYGEFITVSKDSAEYKFLISDKPNASFKAFYYSYPNDTVNSQIYITGEFELLDTSLYTPNGRWIYYDRNGNKIRECSYQKGLMTGSYIEFYEDGKTKKMEGEYWMNKPDGLFTYFSDDNEYQYEEYYLNGDLFIKGYYLKNLIKKTQDIQELFFIQNILEQADSLYNTTESQDDLQYKSVVLVLDELAKKYKEPYIFEKLGLAYWELQNIEKAIYSFEKAKKHNHPRVYEIDYYLGQVALLDYYSTFEQNDINDISNKKIEKKLHSVIKSCKKSKTKNGNILAADSYASIGKTYRDLIQLYEAELKSVSIDAGFDILDVTDIFSIVYKFAKEEKFFSNFPKVKPIFVLYRNNLKSLSPKVITNFEKANKQKSDIGLSKELEEFKIKLNNSNSRLKWLSDQTKKVKKSKLAIKAADWINFNLNELDFLIEK